MAVWKELPRTGLPPSFRSFGECQRTVGTLIEEILKLIREDAEHFDCVSEVEHGRTIIKRGTSAHRQLAHWNDSKGAGNDERAALRSVVDLLIKETASGH